MAGSDARQLVWELGKDQVSEDDIVSLDVHHCYVRATVGTERMPPFSMMVRKPEPGSVAVAQRIRGDAAAYVNPQAEIAAQQERGRQRVHEYRREVERIRQSQTPPDQAKGPANKSQGRDSQRSKHFQPPTGEQPPDQGEEGQSSEEDDAEGGNLSPYRKLLIERQRADADGEVSV